MLQGGVAATWVRGVIDALVFSGLDIDAVCRAAGFDRQAIEQTDAGCPTEKLSALWEAAAELSGNPAIGLAMQQDARPASFDVVGYAMMSSATLMGGLERLARYLRLLADNHRVTLTGQGNVCRISLMIDGGTRPVPRARYESCFLILLTFCRWMAGRDLPLLAVELSHPAPLDRQPYSDAFRAPVSFGATKNCLVFSAAGLATPLPTSNPIMLEMLDKLAGQRIEKLSDTEVDSQVSAQVRDLIARGLPDGEPVRAEIADVLHVSERTLQRQLHREGTTFQQLVDQMRREHAERYLAQPKVTLSEAAYLLGFAEQSIFTRACKRWFQASPVQVRARLREAR